LRSRSDERKETPRHGQDDEEEFISAMLKSIEPLLAEDWNRPEDEWWDTVKGKIYKQDPEDPK